MSSTFLTFLLRQIQYGIVGWVMLKTITYMQDNSNFMQLKNADSLEFKRLFVYKPILIYIINCIYLSFT